MDYAIEISKTMKGFIFSKVRTLNKLKQTGAIPQRGNRKKSSS